MYRRNVIRRDSMGQSPFDIATGLPLHKRTKANYTDVFATVMRKMGERQENLVAITGSNAGRNRTETV